jgi:ABC-type amino acid transport substrate-binding protein
VGFLIPPALADSQPGTLDKIKSSGTLVLGHRESAASFSFRRTDGTPDGYSVDLCLKVAEGIKRQLKLDNLKIKWVQVSAEDRLAAVEKGTVDLECGVTTVTISRMERVDFSNLIFVDGGTMMVKKASGMLRLEDLKGKKVAVQPGTTTIDALRQSLPRRKVNVEIVSVPDLAQGLALLEQGKVDALAGDRTVLVGLGAASKNADQLSLLDEDFSFEPFAFMLRRGDADFRLAVNRELSALYRSGDVDEIFYRWFGTLGNPSVLTKAMFYLNAFQE